jgi:hypothetical protein
MVQKGVKGHAKRPTRGPVNTAGGRGVPIVPTGIGGRRSMNKLPVNHDRHQEDTLLQEKFELQMKIMLGEEGAMEEYMELHHDGTTIMPRDW